MLAVVDENAVIDEKAKAYFGLPQGDMYICNACGSTQKSQFHMICHIESKHLDLRLKCVFCHGISKTRRFLRAHLFKYHKQQLHTNGKKDHPYYILQ